MMRNEVAKSTLHIWQQLNPNPQLIPYIRGEKVSRFPRITS